MPDLLVNCEQIHKSFCLGRTVLTVLRGVTLGIPRGRFLSIMGASGSGKSTLLHILSGLDVPQRGQVFFDGAPLFEAEGVRRIPQGRDAPHPGAASSDATAARGPQSDTRRLQHLRNHLRNRAFGFVFQFYHLLPEFDVLENVLLPQMIGDSVGQWLSNRAAGYQRALELLDRVGLAGRLRHRPNELSGGERQRVAIARALMNRPAVLFADEPTGNLDGRAGEDILRLLQELNESGQTILMVTHDRELAHRADEVVHLVDGRVQ